MHNDPQLNDFRLFCAVARKLSFIAVAKDLDIPTTTLSKRIATLELALGVKLLERTTRRVNLTEEGVRIFGWAERILDVVEEMQADVALARKEARCTVRVAPGARLRREQFSSAGTL